MATCEDAPCCGCCGPAVWAAEAAYEEERATDPDAFYEDYDADEEGEEDAGGEDSREDFGWFGDEALCGE